MEVSLEKQFINSKIVEFKRVCDLVRLVFELTDGKKINLHLQCFFRVYDSDGTLVICSTNMSDRSPKFRKKWYKKYDWTKFGATVFDDAIMEYKDKIFSTKIVSAKFENKDLRFKFENGMLMDVLVSVTKYDDNDFSENYRIFEKGKLEEHFEV